MKTLKPVNFRGYGQGKRLLGLTLISGVLGISFFGCAEPTPEANQTPVTPKPTATTATPKPNSTTPTSQANQTTVTPKPTASATPKPTASATPKPTASATPKPSPTPVSQVNQAPQSELPKPNAQGYYQRTSHKSWQIVDTSGKGVACRMGKATIEQIQTPGNSVVLDIASWPVIGTFKQGQSFEIDLGPAGFGILADNNKQPWIYVEKSADKGAPSKCFVQANNSSVKPLPTK